MRNIIRYSLHIYYIIPYKISITIQCRYDFVCESAHVVTKYYIIIIIMWPQ